MHQQSKLIYAFSSAFFFVDIRGNEKGVAILIILMGKSECIHLEKTLKLKVNASLEIVKIYLAAYGFVCITKSSHGLKALSRFEIRKSCLLPENPFALSLLSFKQRMETFELLLFSCSDRNFIQKPFKRISYSFVARL